jgi:DNA-binding SARP family transcriptional activator/TolB-like protein
MLLLRTLGSASLVDDDGRLVISDQHRRLAILALLAVAGERGLTRAELLHLLWPERPTRKARNSLHQLLYCLRRDAHPDLFGGTDCLRLNDAVITSDVAQFTRARTTGSLEEAVALYGGPLLDGFFISGASEFEQWVETQRTRLHTDYASALRLLAETADARALHSLAVERWRALTALEPLDTQATLGLMRALVAAGDSIGALRHAVAYETLALAEIGQAAAPEINTYVEQLRAVADAPRFDQQVERFCEAAECATPSHPISGSGDRSRAWSRLRFVATSVAALAILLASAGGYRAFQRSDPVLQIVPASDSSAAPAIAIMPFSVNDTALQTWRNGALVLLAADIDGISGLRAIEPQAILALLRDHSAPGDAGMPEQSAMLGIARRTGARYALAGNVVAIGSKVRIYARLYETRSWRRLRELQHEGSPNAIFTLLDALAIDVARAALRREGKAAEVSRVDLARNVTMSLPALKAYLEGEELYQKSRFKEAAQSYQHALEADSTFTLMFGRLVVPYSYVSEATPPSLRDPLAYALRFLDRLPRRDQMLVRASHLLANNRIPEAFDLLRSASRAYPDDYEVWYSLGEVALHESGVLFLPPEEAIRAFEHSVQLNPTFSPPYAHLIELTLGQCGDSARAAEMNAVYERIAPEADNLEWGRLALAFAFGDSIARAQATAVLDTLPLAVVMQLSKYFAQPRLYGAQERALAIVAARAGDLAPEDHPFAIDAFLVRGQLSTAIALALQHDACAPISIYWAYLIGKSTLSIDAKAALQAWHQSSISCRGSAIFVAGGYAADEGRHTALDSARIELATLANERIAAGDTLASNQFLYLAEALRGYDMARTGNVEGGIRTLEAVQPHITRNNSVVRWWLGELLFHAGSFRPARRYFSSFWEASRSIPASLYLGRIDEQLGNHAEARQHYARLAEAWRDADREIQPRVAEARARLAALGGID